MNQSVAFTSSSRNAGPAIGRPVRAISIGFSPGRPLDEISALVDAEAVQGSDILVLPETCRGQAAHTLESLDGPTIRAMSLLAKKHRTYIVCPIDRKHRGLRFNSAVLLDRNGDIAHVYDKIHPFWASEYRLDPPVQSGESMAVCDTDFGRIGLAICFDVNWPNLWRRLADHGVELVIWPSAYPGGRTLQAHAIQNHYYILSATWGPDCSIYDIDGAPIVYDRNNRGGGINVTRATLDLDRCIFHFNLNDEGPLASLLRDRAADVVEEKRLLQENWFVLRALRPDCSARELAARYGLEELRAYIARSEFAGQSEAANLSALALAGTARD